MWSFFTRINYIKNYYWQEHKKNQEEYAAIKTISNHIYTS